MSANGDGPGFIPSNAVETLKNHEERLNNHETRLKNLEEGQRVIHDDLNTIKDNVGQIKGGVDMLVQLKGYKLSELRPSNPGNSSDNVIKMKLSGHMVRWFLGVLFVAITGGTIVGFVLKFMGG